MKFTIDQDEKKLKMFPESRHDYLTLGLLLGTGKASVITEGSANSDTPQTDTTHYAEIELVDLLRRLTQGGCF